jgi:hypothetical protein
MKSSSVAPDLRISNKTGNSQMREIAGAARFHQLSNLIWIVLDDQTFSSHLTLVPVILRSAFRSSKSRLLFAIQGFEEAHDR